jgi:hypothetical protein
LFHRQHRIIARRLLVGACWLAVLSSVPVAAQDRRAARPYRGLFGPEGKNASQVLAVNGAAGIGYDTDLLVEQRDRGLTAGNVSFLHSNDAYSLFAGGISYADSTDGHDFRASAASVARNYSQFATVSSFDSSVGLTSRIRRRTTVSGFANMNYQPWGLMIYAPTVTDAAFAPVVAPTKQIPVVNGSYQSYAGRASITQQLSRRSNVTAGYGYDLAEFSGMVGSFRHHEASLRYSHGMTRSLGWHAGYVYGQVQYPEQRTVYRGRTIDAGLDFMRSLSLTRRTRFGFSTGVSGVDDSSRLASLEYRTRYVATGAAWLNHEIGRTWDVAISYNHNVAFFETLRVPYIYDGINVGIGGLISRRIWVHSSAGATYGDVGLVSLNGATNQFATAVGSAGLMVALSRYVGIAADYSVYAYSLDDATAFWTGFAPQLTRQGVLVSVRTWVPLVERGRRSDATR